MIGIILISDGFAALHPTLDENCIAPVKYLKDAGARAVYMVGNRHCFVCSYGITKLPEIDGVICEAVDFNPYALVSLIKYSLDKIQPEEELCVIDASYRNSSVTNMANYIESYRKCVEIKQTKKGENDSLPDTSSTQSESRKNAVGLYSFSRNVESEVVYPMIFINKPQDNRFLIPALYDGGDADDIRAFLLFFFMFSYETVKRVVIFDGTVDNKTFLTRIQCSYLHHPVKNNQV